MHIRDKINLDRFGLNDVNYQLEDYLYGLRVIFEECTSSGASSLLWLKGVQNILASV